MSVLPCVHACQDTPLHVRTSTESGSSADAGGGSSVRHGWGGVVKYLLRVI